MKNRAYFILLLIIALALNISASFSLAAKPATSDSSLTNNVRIEDDTSFAYSTSKSEEIVAYLQKKYVEDKTFVNNLNKKYYLNVTSKYSDEYFTDVYFDTPSLDLMERKAGLRHRTRKTAAATTPDKALIQLKVSGEDKLTDTENNGSRNEIKFGVKKSAPENAFAEPLDLIPDKEKSGFKDRFEELDINPKNLKPIYRMKQRRRRVGLPLPDGQNFIGFSVDDVSAKRLWAKINFSQMEIELNEITYTNASPAMREEMQQIKKEMIKDLKNKFPYLEQDKEIKHGKAFRFLTQKIPLYAFWIKVGVL